MRTRARYMAFIAAACLLAACGDHPSAASPATKATPSSASPTLPEVTNQVAAVTGGRYTPVVVPASVQFDGAWTLYDNDADYLQINKGDAFTGGIRATLTAFVYHGKAISPKDGRTLIAAPSLTADLRHDPRVRVSRTASVTVGGTSGTELDVSAVKPPLCSYYGDGSKCVNIAPLIAGDPFAPDAQQAGDMLVLGRDAPSLGPGDLPTRLVEVAHGGRTYVFFWVDQAASFATSVTDFEAVLASVQWR